MEFKLGPPPFSGSPIEACAPAVARVAGPMSRARSSLLVIPAIVIVAFEGAGCGGGGSERVSAAELVQRADAICAKERSSFARVQAHPPPNASVAADQTRELI